MVPNYLIIGTQRGGTSALARGISRHPDVFMAAGKEMRVYPWGKNYEPDRCNDREAGHGSSQPIGSYPTGRGPFGHYDVAGNVAEWVNDFYEIPGTEAVVDPLGPDSGEYRVIRGSSWMHGTITDLRISFRDYGLEGRQDLGFRIARFAEPN